MICFLFIFLSLVNALETFTHEAVPGYKLLSNDPSSLKVDDVKQQSGYFDTPSGDGIFYWYFESRGDPSKDPVVVWLNGGPGCSSLEAVIVENGPSRIQNAEGQLARNPWSWNNHANVLYIDNPAKVGYSVGKSVTNSITASEDFKNSIKLFFKQHSELEQNVLHIAGESYAGRYVPVFAEAVNESPDVGKKVESIMIGNGLVNPVSEYDAYQPMLCGKGGWPARFSNNECESMANQTPRCAQSMTQCMDTVQLGNDGGGPECQIASLFCSPLQESFRSLNPYDIRDKGCETTETGLCYKDMDWAQAYFNRPEVMDALGAASSIKQNGFQICSSAVTDGFYQSGDPYFPTFRNVSSLLTQGTPVLAYNGDADIVLNWIGANQWTSETEWPNQQEFQNAQRKDWIPNGQLKRGEIKNYGKFSFLTVHDAGHMVPYNQPESAYYMVQSWINGDYGFSETFNNSK